MPFYTEVAGIPCQCVVHDYQPALPMVVTGPGYGDALPHEPEIFEFHLLDRKGYPAPWLETMLTDEDNARMMREFLGDGAFPTPVALVHP